MDYQKLQQPYAFAVYLKLFTKEHRIEQFDAELSSTVAPSITTNLAKNQYVRKFHNSSENAQSQVLF
jgi:hypothetical protein